MSPFLLTTKCNIEKKEKEEEEVVRKLKYFYQNAQFVGGCVF